MITKLVYLYLWCTSDLRYFMSMLLLCCAVFQSCPILCDSMDCSPPGFSAHGDSPGKNTGVSCHALLQGIFPTQGLNLGLLHCKQILYHLSSQWSPSYRRRQQKGSYLFSLGKTEGFSQENMKFFRDKGRRQMKKLVLFSVRANL